MKLLINEDDDEHEPNRIQRTKNTKKPYFGQNQLFDQKNQNRTNPEIKCQKLIIDND